MKWKKKKSRTNSHFVLHRNFHIPCHLMISRLNSNVGLANEIRIQMTSVTSASTCTCNIRYHFHA